MNIKNRENISFEKKINQENELFINENVISSIVSLVTEEIEGINKINGGISLGKIFGIENDNKGVEIIVNNDKLIIDISLVVESDAKISEIVNEVKNEVKKSVESITGYKVFQVNIFIDGVAYK